MVPRALPPPPPVPPKMFTRARGALQEIDNQQPQCAPVLFTEFK
jgi:hypothetical protein